MDQLEEGQSNVFGSLHEDVVGNDDDSGGEVEYSWDDKSSSKPKKAKKKRFGEEEEEKEEPFMLFDFRKGKRAWPDNVELIDPTRAQELTEQAAKKAEEEAKSKKGKEGEEEGEDKGKKSAGVGWDSWDDDAAFTEKVSDFNILPEDGSFETLKDGSAALVIKNGYRLKLNLNNLLEGGDAKKEERRKKAEAAKKRKAKYGGYSSYGGGGGSYGPQPSEGGGGGGGRGRKDNEDDDEAWKKYSSMAYKEYINEYTITMDVKLLDAIPRDGLSLFQTGLVYLEQSKRSNKPTPKKSDGECQANQNGGVGMFGTYGDTLKAKLEVGSWKRLVISVRAADGGQKGEMRTWIDTEPGVVLKDEAIVANERFAIDPNNLFLFSAGQVSMMPGNIAIRTVRVETAFLDDNKVKRMRARDKILSMFNEERQAELALQQKELSLAPLFPKPRPMWMAPAFVATFGDAFIENTALEGASNLAWSYMVLNYVVQKTIDQSSILSFLPRETRVHMSDSLHIMQQSAVVFKMMLKMLKTPNESQLLSFIKKLKKILAAIAPGETLMLPVMVESNELIILVERSSERQFKFVVVQTESGNMGHHSVSAVIDPPVLRYRTCMVLDGIPKKNALDDVFWVALYNLCIHVHKGDMMRFYDILLPFLTGKPLESSLVEAETVAMEYDAAVQRINSEIINNAERHAAPAKQAAQGGDDDKVDLDQKRSQFGAWRRPQMSRATYVRCVLEALNFLLVSKGTTDLQSKQVNLALYMEFVCMMKNDLSHMLPDKNGQAVCSLAIKELCRAATNFIEAAALGSSGEDCSTWLSVEGKDKILAEVHTVATAATDALNLCKDCGDEDSTPPLIDLTGRRETSVCSKDGDCTTSASECDSSDPAVIQFCDMLAWEAPFNTPDPGQLVNLRKYIPVDLLQIPKRANNLPEAVRAIRMCDRLCTLIENQFHCIKNDKFIIASVIEHVFVQVVPLPRPRKVCLSAADEHRAERSARRDARKKALAEARAAEKKKARSEKQGSGKRLHSLRKKAAASVVDDEDADELGDEDLGDGNTGVDGSKKNKVRCFGEDAQPDFEIGKNNEKAMYEAKCIWDGDMDYELQLELMICLQRLSEHFVAAAMSLQQSRVFDGVVIVVMGCVTALSDVIMRKRAYNEPSEVCSHLMGQTRDGKQLGYPGFGVSVGTFATQSETIEVHYPELSVARTAIIDYFESPVQRRLKKMFSWEENFINVPGKNLVKYLRSVSREVAFSNSKPHAELFDGTPQRSMLMKNYPELNCYRDIVFWWKYTLNTDRKVFVNYSDPAAPRDVQRYARMGAQLQWDWDNENNGYRVISLGIELHCRPDPKQINPLTGKPIPPEHMPTHRFPSTATPSFYVPAPAVKTEDDIIYRPNLPSFEDQHGQVLNQRDSELLLSYLTVPYLRLPLILTFFSTEDRIHKLQSSELREILDSVMFEPGKYMSMDMTGVEPTMVPTKYQELLATPYGLLVNELYRSPSTIIDCILNLMHSAIALDTGSVVDEKSSKDKTAEDTLEEAFNTSTMIILYVARLGSRVDNYLTFMIDWATSQHDCLSGRPLRDVEIFDGVLEKLEAGRSSLRAVLCTQFNHLFEDYLRRLHDQTVKDPDNEKLTDRNSRLACDLHSHKLLLYRNMHVHELTTTAMKTLVGSFVFLTTRHTWNKATREGGRLLMPETALYELLQLQRRRIVVWGNEATQGVVDQVMQTALQVSSSLTGSLAVSAEVLDGQNRWSRIQGGRSVGRWAVGSTRTTAVHATDKQHVVPNPVEGSEGANLEDLPPPPDVPLLKRHTSYYNPVGEVADTGMLGVEIDAQLGQMTLRSKHLAALTSEIANIPDMLQIFGDATVQASLLERAENCQRYRLVGQNHEVQFWNTPHVQCPPIDDIWERDYDPAELFDTETWIINLFEPVRKSFFDGPQPPPMQFMMPEKPLDKDAEVCIVLGLNQSMGGPWKLVYIFRRLKCIHVYECISHGRQWYFSLHMTTDIRYTMRELPPIDKPRKAQFPDWWIRGGGSPYPRGVQGYLCNELDGLHTNPAHSVVIVREPQHRLNISGGSETFIPARFLFGLVPQELLDTYRFWQDESIAPRHGNPAEASPGAYKRLRGYPVDEESDHMVIVEFLPVGSWEAYVGANSGVTKTRNQFVMECTGYPGRSVRILRRSKKAMEAEFHQYRRIAQLLEALCLVSHPSKKLKSSQDKDAGEDGALDGNKFKVDDNVECDIEGNNEFLPCVVVRINDSGTYDLEFVGEFKWMGVQKDIDADMVQARGDSAKRLRGEGVWHWEGMSDSEDEDWRDNDSNNGEASDNDDEDAGNKKRLCFGDFDHLWILLQAAAGSETLLMQCLERIGARRSRQSAPKPYPTLRSLADVVSYEAKDVDAAAVESFSMASSEFDSESLFPYHEEEDAMIFLNMLYAPRRSRLFSIMKVLTRIEHVGHICPWVKCSSLKNIAACHQGAPYSCPDIDLVELPRLKLTFTLRADHEGVLRLYSVDHVDLYITNDRNSGDGEMLAGIPHSLLLSNIRGETQVLAPVVKIARPLIYSEPFSTFIVLNYLEMPLSERFFLYPIHISLSFLLTKGLNSALYLILMRLLHRDYTTVFRLADSIATDTSFNTEGLEIFKNFIQANGDWHPDAHACRLKISLVTIDSGTASPWNLTVECAKYITKLEFLSSSCRLALEEELQLLESDFVVLSQDSPGYDSKLHDEISMTLCYNRLHQLRTLLSQSTAQTDAHADPHAQLSLCSASDSDGSTDGESVECKAPYRLVSTNWPYYVDNTVFGENYVKIQEVLTSKGTDEFSWQNLSRGGDEQYAPPGGWLVVACFHTLWSTGSLKVMPNIAELAPLYQDSTTFISVRADSVDLIQTARTLNVKKFPTFVVLRGGNEVHRIEGSERVIEKIVGYLAKNVSGADKTSHQQRRLHRKMERDAANGGVVDEDEIDPLAERPQLDWTWDPEQCGENMCIEHDGMEVVMKEKEDEWSKASWEWSKNEYSWTPFSDKLNKKMEQHYISGQLYSNCSFYDDSGDLWFNQVKVTSYCVEGFMGDFEEANDYSTVYIRRKGDRLSVPGEEPYVSGEQKKRDKALAQYNEKVIAYKQRMKVEMWGKDVEIMRGTIGLMQNTGVHRWNVIWNHIPPRDGACDAFGLVSECCETYGPTPTPGLGGLEGGGVSLGIFANGEVYHNGKLIRKRDLTAENSIPSQFIPAGLVERIAANKLLSDQTADGGGGAGSGDVCEEKKSEAEVIATAAPMLFGRNSLIQCELDTSSQGGTLHVFVNGERLEDLEISNLYSLLGGTELFPSVCLCPLGAPPVTDVADGAEGKADGDNAVDDSEKEEAQKKKKKIKKSAAQADEDDDENEDKNDDEEGEDSEEGLSLVFPSILLFSGDDALVDAEAELERRMLKDLKVESDEEKKEDASDAAAAPVTQDSAAGEVEKAEEKKEIGDEIPTPVSEEVEPQSADAGAAVDDTPPIESAVEVPVDKVIWMYETEEEGWMVYSAEISRELEEAHRSGVVDHALLIGDETFRCHLEAKTQKTDDGKQQKMRRHVLSDGPAALWETLTMKYEKPLSLSGQGMVKALEKIWSENAKLSDGLGFIFLYTLLSGDVKCRVVPTYGYGGYGGGGYSSGYGGGYGGGEGYGGYGGYGKSSSMSANDAHRFAVLCTQLLADRQAKSLPASVLNVLCRNRQVALRMPKFKDTRKTSTVFFRGWVDETEPRSPLADLFVKLVPLMRNMKKKMAFHFPPPPPHAELPAPLTSYRVVINGDRGSASADVHAISNSRCIKMSLDWEKPEVSDYACEQRRLVPVQAETIRELTTFSLFRLESDSSIKPQPPINVKSPEHFDAIVAKNPDRLLVLDFFASWCAPCKVMAPVFRHIALQTPTPLFLKIDVDECESLASAFGIQSLPTFHFIRKGGSRDHIVGTIEGGGPHFIVQFAEFLTTYSTKDELQVLKSYAQNIGGAYASALDDKLAVSQVEMETMAFQPLRDLDKFVVMSTRQDLGMDPISGQLEFDISQHDAAKTPVASSVLKRMKDDVLAFAQHANDVPVPKLKNLSDLDLLLIFSAQPKEHELGTLKCAAALGGARAILKTLQTLHKADLQFIQDMVPLLDKVSNFVDIDKQGEERPASSKRKADVKDKLMFLLRRQSGQNATIWVEFLFSVLLSSDGANDLIKLNPHLPRKLLSGVINLVAVVMLRANRMGIINRCIASVISLQQQLKKIKELPGERRSAQAGILIPKLTQVAGDIAGTIKLARHYLSKDSDGGLLYDPRYLVFEFVWNIQLRQKQVEIVNNFRHHVKIGSSKVKQMIMGAGKTSVVAPLLALILADGKSLVLSVVPKALVEMSRTRMRETFAAIMVKRIYTLDFDRSKTVRPAMRRSLENAAKNRGIVVATPTTIKSIMLSYVEVLQHINEAKGLGQHTKVVELADQASELAKILKLFREGVMLLDEVDLILHPLKSELNFPCGDKFDLDGSDDGIRWGLPIHLMDALFFTQTGRSSTFEATGSTLEILNKLSSCVKIGTEKRHLQRLPHVTLLNVDYYHQSMKPIFAEWAYLWLQKQHIHGIEKHETLTYILEGASARSDCTAKVSLVELAVIETKVKMGELSPMPALTLAHQRSLSDESRSTLEREREEARLAVKRKIADADPDELQLLELQLKHLNITCDISIYQRDIVNQVYEIDEQMEAKTRSAQGRLDELQGRAKELRKAIDLIECPRDDSLDNSVIVWQSQSFGALAGAGAADASGTGTIGESSVSAICNKLEDAGVQIRRCSDFDEVISRVRDLQSENKLRCVIIGGDETSAGCGPGCVKNRHNGPCLRCGSRWSAHSGHICPIGGRGTWRVENSDGKKQVSPLVLVKALTDTESVKVVQGGPGALPAHRVALYSAHEHVKEEDRQSFWEIGNIVTEDPKQLTSWAANMPSWTQNSDTSGEDVDDDIDDDELPGAAPPLLKRESSTAETANLAVLRAELEEVESATAVFADEEEATRKSFQLRAVACHKELVLSVEKRIEILSSAAAKITAMLIACGITPSDKKPMAGIHSGRDAAMGLAWLEWEETVKPLHSLVDTAPAHLVNIKNEIYALMRMLLAAKVVAYVTSPLHKKLLNLCNGWLTTFLPHCLAKINRVSFGLLSSDHVTAALKADPHCPRSRLKLAVPFVGKDVPSRSSEFAHPDVTIGLTILAYRYSGLRKEDFLDVVDGLTSQFRSEIGPARERSSNLLHEHWVHSAGGVIRGIKTTADGKPWVLSDLSKQNEKEVVQLKFLQKSNEEQLKKLYDLICHEPLVIHYYLEKSIFLLHLRNQRTKISASGQAVGGDMLVGLRVGFSGTPSDLLPEELGKCDYETGDDGMMLTTMLDRKVTSYEFLQDKWNVELLLDQIATADDNYRFHALIDTGALITGYSNKEVAEQLLERGLKWAEGVVFLDDDDKQQVLVRATGRVVSADQCGVPLEKRFAFYDQIHTTGMDIKHVVNALAVITLGKDMIFRDYVQGAYRMRGIGMGQRIHVFIIPEVRELIQRELKTCSAGTKAGEVAVKADSADVSMDIVSVKHPFDHGEEGTSHVLEDVVAWLIINSLRSEQTQWTMLCIQNISNLYRKNAFKLLLESVTDIFKAPAENDTTTVVVTGVDGHAIPRVANAEEAMKMYIEPLTFDLESGVPDPLPFEEKLRAMLTENQVFLTPEQHEIGQRILTVVGQFSLWQGDSSNRLDTEQEREQEQEQEKEVEARRDQQVEVEKFIDREYSRQEELQRPWPFSMLSKPLNSESYRKSDHPFYPLNDFKLRHHEPLSFPDGLYLSSNYFNPDWTGLRRVKNVVVVMEYAPIISPEYLRPESIDEARVVLNNQQEEHLAKAHSLFGFHANAAGSGDVLFREDLENAIQSILDEKPSAEVLNGYINSFCKDASSECRVTLDEFRDMVTSGRAQPKSKGRHWVALSLAEAETIRRILHVRSQRAQSEEKASATRPDKDVCVALRYSPVSGGHVSSLTGSVSNAAGANINAGGLVLDSSLLWDRQLTARGLALSPAIGATKYEATTAHSAFRFFDCDMHYVPRALNILVRELHGSVRERERFFNATIGCRRRMDRKWQDTPLAKVFTVPDEWVMLKQKSQAVFVREALKAKNLSLWEAFTAFDNDNNGLLSPAEFYGALLWLNVPNLTAEDVVDFLEAADTNRDGVIDYKEYLDMITPPGTADESAGDVDVVAEGESEERTTALAKVDPFGGEQLREVIIRRRQAELLRLKEERTHLAAYKEALDIKVFEEELLQSRNRKGGANPLVSNVSLGSESGTVRQVDFKFFTNQHPLRLVPAGKNAFFPIFMGTAAQRPVTPMNCPKKHGLQAANYSWMNCTNCRSRGVAYVCACWCGFYLCAACYDGDRRAKEADRINPAKHPTYLKCYNGCSFTVQIPAASAPSIDGEEAKSISAAEADSENLDYSVSLEIRVEKLPPKGLTLSLLRVTLPGSGPTRKKNSSNLFIDSSGRVVCAFPADKHAPVTSTFHDMRISAPGPVVETTLPEGSTENADSTTESVTPAAPASVSKTIPVTIKPSTWHVVTVSVRPRQGSMCSFVDGNLCHAFNGRVGDVNSLKLQHKLTVLGGGRQAEARGADVRRLVIHDGAVGGHLHNADDGYMSDRETAGAIEALPLNKFFTTLANDHPGIGGRALRIQTVYRGFIVRHRVKKVAEAEAAARAVESAEKEGEE